MLMSVRSDVCLVQVCLEQSIFIFLGQRAIEQSESNRVVREQSQNSQRAIREHSGCHKRALRALKSDSYSRSLKYCVLLSLEFQAPSGPVLPSLSYYCRAQVQVASTLSPNTFPQDRDFENDSQFSGELNQSPLLQNRMVCGLSIFLEVLKRTGNQIFCI